MKLSYDEDPSDNMSEGSPDNQRNTTTQIGFSFDNKIIVLSAIILVLVIIIVVLLALLWNGNRKNNDDSHDIIQEEITSYAEETNSDENTSDSDENTEPEGSLPIVVAPDSVIPSSDSTPSNSGSYTSEFSEKDLQKDLADEDESYTKEFILPELFAYYQEDAQDAIYDLVKLRRYRKLSYSLKGTNQYYYYGDTDESGLPNGIGLAIYADNTYYYGSFSHGMFDGTGTWQRYYVYGTEKASLAGSYSMHSYSGQWKNSLPNGDGHEHFDTEVDKFPSDQEIYQNIIGHFTNGLYDGEMYATTVDFHGMVREWYGTATLGTFELKSDMSSIGECPVWVNSQDDTIFFQVMKKDNHDLGITELINFGK